MSESKAGAQDLPTSQGFALQVFFDGTCHLCSREVAHYRKRDVDHRIEWIDIAHPDFIAAEYGLDPKAVNAVMHARVLDDPKGVRVATAVDAFLEIWRVIPGFHGLASLVRFPLLRPFIHAGYHAFAKIRLKLPRRKVEYECKDGVCRPGFLKGETKTERKS